DIQVQCPSARQGSRERMRRVRNDVELPVRGLPSVMRTRGDDEALVYPRDRGVASGLVRAVISVDGLGSVDIERSGCCGCPCNGACQISEQVASCAEVILSRDAVRPATAGTVGESVVNQTADSTSIRDAVSNFVDARCYRRRGE